MLLPLIYTYSTKPWHGDDGHSFIIITITIIIVGLQNAIGL
jgi:uncharacterized membrane protein (DUF4010 family)